MRYYVFVAAVLACVFFYGLGQSRAPVADPAPVVGAMCSVER
jgi:hypothetical protein